MAGEPVCPEPEPHAAPEKKRDKTALLRKALTCTAGRPWPAFRRSQGSRMQFRAKKSQNAPDLIIRLWELLQNK